MPPRRPSNLRVVLTRSPQRFVPRAPAGAEVIGIVERGMEIGALARLKDGTFVQVNGNIIQSLDQRGVEEALREARQESVRRRAGIGEPPRDALPPSVADSGARPVVSIKRRRVVRDERRRK